MISKYYKEISFGSNLIKIRNTNIFVTKAPIHKKYAKDFDFDEKFLCNPEMAFQLADKHEKKLTLVINLDCDLYSKYENKFKTCNIRCKKIGYRSKDGLVYPTLGSLRYFCNFLHKNDMSMKSNEAILIHSNLGLDRVACFLCNYWMLSERISATQAVDLFETLRGHNLLNAKTVIDFLYDVQGQIPRLQDQTSLYEAPNGWLDYSKMGDLVENTKFIALKTPLCTKFYKNVLDKETFYCKDAVQMVQDKGFRVGMVLSLSNTDRHYDRNDFIESDVFFEKLKVPGQVIPSDWIIKMFCSKVAKFEEKNKENNSIILVHCTHGLNRTGFLVCSYLMRNKGLTASKAIDCFEKARGHKISRETYLTELLSVSKVSDSHFDSCKTESNENKTCLNESSRHNDENISSKKISSSSNIAANFIQTAATTISNTSDLTKDIEPQEQKNSLQNSPSINSLEIKFPQTANNKTETKQDQPTCETECCLDNRSIQKNEKNSPQKPSFSSKLDKISSTEVNAPTILNTSDLTEDVEPLSKKKSLQNSPSIKSLEIKFLQEDNNKTETKKDQPTCETQCFTDNLVLQSCQEETEEQNDNKILKKRHSSSECPLDKKIVKRD